MGENQGLFLFGYGALVILIALSILFIRKGSRPPVRLHLKTKDEKQLKTETASPRTSASEPVSENKTRVLNVFFNYNGHTWDAYEVLGIPAGSSKESARASFEKQMRLSQEARPFMEAALEAILKS